MDGQTDGPRGCSGHNAPTGQGQRRQRSARGELLHHEPGGSRFPPRMPVGPRHAAPRPSCLEKPFFFLPHRQWGEHDAGSPAALAAAGAPGASEAAAPRRTPRRGDSTRGALLINLTEGVINYLKPLLALSATFGFHSRGWEAPAGAATLSGNAAQGSCLSVDKGQGRKAVALPSAAPSSPFLEPGRAYRGSSRAPDSKGKVSKGRRGFILQPKESVPGSPAPSQQSTCFS